MTEIWTWILDHKIWILAVLCLAVAYLVWRRVRAWVSPPSQVPPVAVPSAKQVEQAKEQIKEQADKKKEQIQKDNEDIKKKIIDKFGPGLLLLCLSLWSCSSEVVRPTITSAPLENMITTCQRNEDVVTCPRPIFSSGMQSWADCLADEAECQTSLDEARGLASIDLSAAVARAQNAEYQLAQEKNKKWIWGTVGICAGLILGAGITVAAILAK